MDESAAPNDGTDYPLRGTTVWHYLLAFAGFGLFTLVLMSTKYERRQTEIEQEFHGIEQMQRSGTGGATEGQGRALSTPDQKPLLITLRPLMIVLGAITCIAWIALTWLTSRRRSATGGSVPPRENDES